MMIASHSVHAVPHANMGMNFQEMSLSQNTVWFLEKKILGILF